jgi:hypothetical protein
VAQCFPRAKHRQQHQQQEEEEKLTAHLQQQCYDLASTLELEQQGLEVGSGAAAGAAECSAYEELDPTGDLAALEEEAADLDDTATAPPPPAAAAASAAAGAEQHRRIPQVGPAQQQQQLQRTILASKDLEQLQQLTAHPQQQSYYSAATLQLEQLQQLLATAWTHKGSSAVASALLPFYAWSTACGSTDVRTLLQHPAVFLQHLQQRHSPSTAAVYLSHVIDVLALPAVAALLSQPEFASLLQQLAAARQGYELVSRTPAERAAAAAAAVAAAALAGSGLVPATKRREAAVPAAAGLRAKRQRRSTVAAAQ